MPALDLTTPHNFRPHGTSRRGELYAWVATIVVILTLIAVNLFQGTLSILGIGFAAFLALSAIFISLANWMERNTTLELDENGVAFRNGLRDARLRWDEINSIEVTQRNLERRVHVLGEHSHFSFNTEGAVKLGEQISEKTGFAQGEAILDTILEKTSLTRKTNSDERVYYYSRQ